MYEVNTADNLAAAANGFYM